MDVCLYEDRGAADLEPLTLTRPVFDLLCGQSSLADKQARYFQATARTAVVRPHLADLVRLQSPGMAVNDFAGLGLVVVVNGRWLPPAGVAVDLSGPCVGVVGDEPAYAVVDAEAVHGPHAGRRGRADGAMEGDAAVPRGRRPALPLAVGNRRPQRRPDHRRLTRPRNTRRPSPVASPARR